MTPVHEAAEDDDAEELEILLNEEPGLVEAVHGWRRDRPLHVATYNGSVEAAHLLLDRGADINSRNIYGATPLMRACESGRAESVAMLLARGADPTLVTSTCSWTSLMYASFGTANDDSDYVAVIQLLLKDGRLPADARTVDGKTALWWACVYGCADRARVLLLDGRADHTLANDEEETPMAAARHHEREACIELLEVRWHLHIRTSVTTRSTLC